MVIKRVLITGANGYLGSRMADSLATLGYEVIAHCNSMVPDDVDWRNKMFNTIQGDIRSKDTLASIKAHSPQAIIHLISLDHVQSGKDVHQTMQINVQSTWDLLEIAKNGNAQKFIYFSTIHSYGPTHSGIIDEKSHTAPSNVYGLTHLLSEQIVAYYHRISSLESINLRLSNSYGEPRIEGVNCWQLVVNDLCRSAFLNKKIVLQSDGSTCRDFIHYSTINKSLDYLLKKNPKEQEQTFNLCSGQSIKLIDLAQIVSSEYTRKFGEQLPVFINGTEPVTLVGMGTTFPQFDTRLLIDFIKTPVGLNEGIRQIFDYLQNKS